MTSSILIPSHSSFICNGDFLLALKSPDSVTPTVCHVHSTLCSNQLNVIWWMNQDEISSRGIVDSPPPVPINSYSNVLKCRLTEVYELSSSFSTIDSNLVMDLAFVFHIDALEYDVLNCAGMSRVFYTRYRYDDANQLVQVYCHQHTPFSNIISKSFPSYIWNSILDVKEKVQKCLNEHQFFSYCWKHGFTNLSSARSLFGCTFGIGVRTRAPNKGDPSVTLHFAGAVTLLDVPPNSYTDRREFVSGEEIDFLFESFTRMLKVHVRYSKVDANEPIVLS
jgi:hypothetical protein